MKSRDLLELTLNEQTRCNKCFRSDLVLQTNTDIQTGIMKEISSLQTWFWEEIIVYLLTFAKADKKC